MAKRAVVEESEAEAKAKSESCSHVYSLLRSLLSNIGVLPVYGLLADQSGSSSRKEPIKRQRTSSNSQSPSFDKPKSNRTSSSDEALAAIKQSEHSPKKIRGAAARNHREKEQREQREKERADAAGRRKARSEKRRGDGMAPFPLCFPKPY